MRNSATALNSKNFGDYTNRPDKPTPATLWNVPRAFQANRPSFVLQTTTHTHTHTEKRFWRHNRFNHLLYQHFSLKPTKKLFWEKKFLERERERRRKCFNITVNYNSTDLEFRANFRRHSKRNFVKKNKNCLVWSIG